MKTRKIAIGSFLRVIEFFANILVGFVLMPLIISTLGDKMYGLWVFVGSFLGYYGIMDFGIGTAVQRFLSQAIGARKEDEINRIVNTAFLVFVVIGIVAFIFSIFIAFGIPLLVSNITNVRLFQIIILILGIDIALGFPLRVFHGILTANIRYELTSGIGLVKLILRAILIVLFLKKGFGILALTLITFSLDIFGYITKYFLVKKFYSFIVLKPSFFEMNKVRVMLGFSFYAFIGAVADQIRFNVDNLVIATFLGFSAVTVYSIGARLISYFSEFMRSIFGFTIPVFSQYEGAGDYHSIREKYIFLTKISSYLSILIGGILIILGKAFIISWVGEKYIESYTILLILLIPFIFDVMQGFCGGLLLSLAKHKYCATINVVEAIANLVISVILVQQIGIIGVAIGTAIPMLIIRIFVQPLVTCKIVGIKYRFFYGNVIAPILCFSCLFLFIYWLIIKGLIIPRFFRIGVLALIPMILFPIFVYLFGFQSVEKEYFKKLLKLPV